MIYKFDDKNHIHTLDGVPLHGVTTVLSVIAKPALIQWAANQAVEYIIKSLPGMAKLWVDGKDKEVQDIVNEAKYAHRKKKDKAGDWGTLVHKAVEEWIKNKVEPKLEESQQKAFDNFKKWAEDNKVEFLESEKHVWSKELWIGGITDMVIKMDGKKYVADIKTSGAIYNEHFFQMAAYDLCLKEMGGYEDVEGYLVINLKKDGTMDLKRADNLEINRQAFLSALTLYKIINSLK